MTDYRKIGLKEAKEVDVSLPFKERVAAEIRNYNKEYGIASTADVVTELKTRGLRPRFQGELEVYSHDKTGKVQRLIDELIREGKVRRVKVAGSKAGYVYRARDGSYRSRRK